VYHVTDDPGVAGGYGEHVDYEEMALELESDRAHRTGGADAIDFDARQVDGGPDWDPTWRGGDSWRHVAAEPVEPRDAMDAAAEAAAQAANTRLRRRAADTAASLAGQSAPSDIWASPRGAHHSGASPHRVTGRSAAGGRSESLDLIVPGRMSATQRGPTDEESAGRMIPAPTKPQPRHFPPQEAPPAGRLLHQVYQCTVGSCSFRLLHLLEGRWNGEAQVMLPATAAASASASTVPAPRVCASSLDFDDTRGLWMETQRFTASDGTTITQRLILRPVQDGVCSVTVEGEATGVHSSAHFSHRSHIAKISASSQSFSPRRPASDDEPFSDESGEWASSEMELLLREVGPSMLLLTGSLRATGTPVLVETMTVVDNLRRARTVQRFDATGALQSVFAMRETRVIDAVTGAMATSS
jgi:hypothetical protein